MRGTVVRSGRVLAAPGHQAPLGPTAVHLDQGRIVRLEPLDAEDLTPEEAGTLLMPALADAHDHGKGLRTLACGVADGPLETWLADLAIQPKVDPYLAASVAFARMAEGGVCCANHCHNTQDSERLFEEAEAVSRAARDVGVAVAFALPFFDRNSTVYGDLDRLLKTLDPADREKVAAQARALRPLSRNMELAERVAALEHEFFRFQYCPVGPQWASHETLAAIAEASHRTGRRVHMHMLETERQRRWADREYPEGLFAFLDSIGLLTARLTLAHAVWLRPDECALLAERGVTVSINVSSNLRLQSGRAPLEALRSAGVPFGIGLDGMAFDDDEDMLREIRLVWHMLGRGHGMRPLLEPSELFDAAVLAGRRTIVGDDGGGRIEPGAPADLLTLDMAEMTRDCVPEEGDLVGILLTRAASRHVRDVVVAGRRVVEAGACVTVDIPAAERELRDQGRRSWAANPPDLERLSRLKEKVAAFYEREDQVPK